MTAGERRVSLVRCANGSAVAFSDMVNRIDITGQAGEWGGIRPPQPE